VTTFTPPCDCGHKYNRMGNLAPLPFPLKSVAVHHLEIRPPFAHRSNLFQQLPQKLRGRLARVAACNPDRQHTPAPEDDFLRFFPLCQQHRYVRVGPLISNMHSSLPRQAGPGSRVKVTILKPGTEIYFADPAGNPTCSAGGSVWVSCQFWITFCHAMLRPTHNWAARSYRAWFTLNQ
jgi:hypothetical protein